MPCNSNHVPCNSNHVQYSSNHVSCNSNHVTTDSARALIISAPAKTATLQAKKQIKFNPQIHFLPRCPDKQLNLVSKGKNWSDVLEKSSAVSRIIVVGYKHFYVPPITRNPAPLKYVIKIIFSTSIFMAEQTMRAGGGDIMQQCHNFISLHYVISCTVIQLLSPPLRIIYFRNTVCF